MRNESVIYFNPNWNPEEFYPLIKPLSVMYDKIILWSPLNHRLEKYGFKSEDFLKACSGDEKNAPSIIPVYREAWFDLKKRESHPDFEVRRMDRNFEKRIEDIVKGSLENKLNPYKTVLPHADYATSYSVTQSLYDEKYDDFINSVAKTRQSLSESFQLRIEQVAKEQNKSESWCLMNAFAQDIVAMRSIGVSHPFIHQSHLDIYNFLTDRDERQDSGVYRQTYLSNEIHDLPGRLSVKELADFLNDAFNAQYMSWTDILELRHGKREKIRTYMQYALSKFSTPLSETAKMQAEQMYAREVRDAEKVELISEVFKLIGMRFLFARFRGRLVKNFSKISHKGQPIELLMDTNFYQKY